MEIKLHFAARGFAARRLALNEEEDAGEAKEEKTEGFAKREETIIAAP